MTKLTPEQQAFFDKARAKPISKTPVPEPPERKPVHYSRAQSRKIGRKLQGRRGR
jgi:hypothetical protein